MFERLYKFWMETMEIKSARWVVICTLLLILVVIAIYLIRLFRDQALGSKTSVDGSLLDEIRRWKQTGIVDEDEFEQVQQTAARRLRDEFQATGSAGNQGGGVGPVDLMPVRVEPRPRPKTLAEMQALKAAAAAGGGASSAANPSNAPPQVSSDSATPGNGDPVEFREDVPEENSGNRD